MISVFLSLRRMATEYPSMIDGGMLWFTDLSIVDPTYSLPLMAGCLTFLTIELGTDTGQAMQQQVLSLLPGESIVMEMVTIRQVTA